MNPGPDRYVQNPLQSTYLGSLSGIEYCIWLVANRHWVVLGIQPKAVDLFKRQKLLLCRLWNPIETLWPRSSLRRYPLASSTAVSLRWRHNSRDGPSDHQCLGCLLSRLFRRRSRKTTKFRATGLCEGNPPVTDGFRSQRASNVENVSMWWRPHDRYFFMSHQCNENVLCNVYVVRIW